MLLAIGTLARAQGGPPRCQDIADSAARLACFDAQTAQPAAAPAKDPAETFGKPPADKDRNPEPKEIQTRLLGTFSRWEKGTVFKLENGQVWKATGDEDGYYPNVPDNPPVTIKRGFLGAYWLIVEPTGRQIKVKRIK